ncbi:MAG: tetratricopeptide repeat protein, partial [Sinobacteraceae bacterium]|nr:tetratricopeptide repeat protein [Nevskiaceae bacterium]
MTTLLACGQLMAADKKDERTIKDLESHPVTVNKNAKLDAGASKAMENYRRFLELQKTDPQLRAEAMRRLGDLNLDAGELERMEKEVTAVDLQGAEAIRLYSTLLKAYPDYARNDQVLYQLARAYETTAQPDRALATLDLIIQRYPRSPQLDEVQFRRGELLFSAKRYAEAEKAYAAVVQQGKASRFYEQSLYKHGWSLFKQSQTEESLPSFAGVLDAKLIAAGGKPVRIEDLKRADRELVEDTLRVMSITFSYSEGSSALDQFMKKNGERSYSYLLYSRLGDLYVDKQRFQDAATTYRAYVARDPYSDQAPNLAMQAIEAYNKGGFSQLVLDGKHEFVEHYNFSSPFWKSRDRARYPTVVQELKTNMKDVATYFHATAQKSHKPEDYQEAARWYRDYLKSFPDDPDSAGTNYLLAETLFESHQYADAATEYERTAYNYPRNDKSATAAYASLVAYQKGEEALSGTEKTQWHQRATEAGVRFAQTFPEHPDSAGVLTRAAEEIFAARDLPRAISIAQSILARQPPVDSARQRIAWTIVAQSNFDQGNYAQAEPAFAKARDLSGNDEKLRNDLSERLAATVYKEGEAKVKAGDSA